jgi:acetone carboxylase alpha subunit
VKGVHETSEGPYITAPHRSGDIFTHAYNGGGGFGDVLERDPIKTASDVENGFLTAQAAQQVFGIVLKEDREGILRVDLAATTIRRKAMRTKRLKKSVPVSQWMKGERQRVAAGRYVIEVTRMYASAMKLSKSFTKDFNSFWGLNANFTYKVED